MTERELLHEALVAGRTREAARIAGRLARAGAWDGAVAATLYVHGRADAPERAHADAWFDVPVCAVRLAAGAGDGWPALIEALVDGDRGAEALHGLELAAAAGVVGSDLFLRLAVALYTRGHAGEARRAAEAAADRFAGDATAWATVAFLRLETGALTAAVDACATALLLNPAAPLALLTGAVLVPEQAPNLLRAAGLAGVPEEILAGYRRRVG